MINTGSCTVSVNKKLVAYHIGRLKDHDPQIRLRTIQELAQLGDPEALEALHSVFENDSDPGVRKAAQDAGRAIFTNQKTKP
jgi:HEAT repeat protein